MGRVCASGRARGAHLRGAAVAEQVPVLLPDGVAGTRPPPKAGCCAAGRDSRRDRCRALWKDCSPGRCPVFAVPPAGLRGCSWVRTEGWPPFLTVTSYLLCLHGSSLTAPTDLSFQSLLTFSSKSPEEKLTPTSKQVRGAAPGRLRGSLHRQGLSERSRERARLAWPDTELPPSSPAAS